MAASAHRLGSIVTELIFSGDKEPEGKESRTKSKLLLGASK